ncbi:MAG: hypothetical protein RM347_032310 [Nostoc sp. ChiQUE02]|uniref:hypothetical protein n=1 Tax=Nostoc sp. ChiQUE02 TaxID=3075377 RepID=UPI002AD2FBC2|nr:hypothetical protein [Nostoc sp. ChiQUE02]MDZ8228780.1 hypothetical protein [Nostoc sp. ChiQUE02]
MPKAGYAYASHSLDQGAPVQSVRQILRHTYLHNTLPYTHAKQALVSSAREKGAMGYASLRERCLRRATPTHFHLSQQIITIKICICTNMQRELFLLY